MPQMQSVLQILSPQSDLQGCSGMCPLRVRFDHGVGHSGEVFVRNKKAPSVQLEASLSLGRPYSVMSTILLEMKYKATLSKDLSNFR